MEKILPIPEKALWQNVQDQTALALDCGALQCIATDKHIIPDGNIPFLVHVAQNLQRKIRAKQQNDAQRPDFNPFLPPESPLTVGAIGTQHLAVLNKFNVVPHHLLIVTRMFQSQEALLTQADFAALCWALREIDGLGFYNGGSIAGASQRHKHLQLIPSQMEQGQTGFPVETVFPDTLSLQPGRLKNLPFTHRIAAIPHDLTGKPFSAADYCHRLYRKMLSALRITGVLQHGIEYQSAPYNLLLTRRWMMVVPRSLEHFETISINAMGFAGSLFVRNREALERIRQVRPLTLLKAVSAPETG